MTEQRTIDPKFQPYCPHGNSPEYCYLCVRIEPPTSNPILPLPHRLRQNATSVDCLADPDPAILIEAADEIVRLERASDVAWAAGLFEGKGAICIAQKFKSIRKQNGDRIKSGYRAWLVVHSTDHDVLRKFGAIVGTGKFYGPYKDKRSDKYKPQLRWATTNLEEAHTVLRLLLPYLGERRTAKARECLAMKYVRKVPRKAA